MSTEFRKCDKEVQEVLNKVVKDYYSDDLADIDIKLLFKIAKKSKFAAKIMRISDMWFGFGAQADFGLVIFKPIWDASDSAMKEAIIDRELARICITENKEGEMNLSLKDYEIQDFVSVIKRRGNYTNELKQLSQLQFAKGKKS